MRRSFQCHRMPLCRRSSSGSSLSVRQNSQNTVLPIGSHAKDIPNCLCFSSVCKSLSRICLKCTLCLSTHANFCLLNNDLLYLLFQAIGDTDDSTVPSEEVQRHLGSVSVPGKLGSESILNIYFSPT